MNDPAVGIDPAPHRPLLSVLLVMALLFVVVLPVLPTREMGRTLENLNIATALEMRRDGHWLFPTLEGLPRTKKPPLAAWITAWAISPRTVHDCSSRDPAIRDSAFRRLALEARWPALLQACLALLGVYSLGRSVGGASLGVIAALIAASSYQFIRFAQVTLTDVPLMLWVITANAFIAVVIFQRRIWLGSIGAGIALGLAFMSKGPVCFVQTLAPLIVWQLWRKSRKATALQRNHRRIAPALATGIIAFFLIATPWYLATYLQNPSAQWQTWLKEVTGTDAPDRSDPRLVYVPFLIVMLFPWLLFWFGGLYLAARDALRKPTDADPQTSDRYVYLLFLVLVPVVIMTCFKDRKDRYLLPLIAPAAVLTARCAKIYLAHRPASAKRDWFGWLHWTTLILVALALPILGAAGRIKSLTTLDHRPWFSPSFAAAAIASALVIGALGLRAHLLRKPGTFLYTIFLMLLVVTLIELGYRNTVGGRSKMRPSRS